MMFPRFEDARPVERKFLTDGVKPHYCEHCGQMLLTRVNFEHPSFDYMTGEKSYVVWEVCPERTRQKSLWTRFLGWFSEGTHTCSMTFGRTLARGATISEPLL